MFDFIDIITASLDVELIQYLYGSFGFLGIILLVKNVVMGG